jgi:hypothetical protein
MAERPPMLAVVLTWTPPPCAHCRISATWCDRVLPLTRRRIYGIAAVSKGRPGHSDMQHEAVALAVASGPGRQRSATARSTAVAKPPRACYKDFRSAAALG